MHTFQVRTRILQPPKDGLYAVLDEALPQLHERDVVLVTSKVVAIHQGRCIPVTDAEQHTLVTQEADRVLGDVHDPYVLTIIHHALLANAGIDKSNADGHYVLLPEDPFAEAQQLHTYLKEKHQLSKLGVIITDSHCAPLRYGSMGIALAWWGMYPMRSYSDTTDLFGRSLPVTSVNIVDGLATAASVECGEGSESTPVTIIRDCQTAAFTEEDTRSELFIPPQQDIFRPFFQ